MWNVTVRVLDHEVAVQREDGDLAQRFHDRKAQRQVRDEVVVHHVHVHPVGGLGHGRHLVGEPGEVRVEDRRRDLNGHALSLASSLRWRRIRARYMASVPCRCGQSWTSGPEPRSGTPGRNGRASICEKPDREARTAATTERVSARCGEQVT
jgi:hypothetical protein